MRQVKEFEPYLITSEKPLPPAEGEWHDKNSTRGEDEFGRVLWRMNLGNSIETEFYREFVVIHHGYKKDMNWGVVMLGNSAAEVWRDLNYFLLHPHRYVIPSKNWLSVSFRAGNIHVYSVRQLLILWCTRVVQGKTPVLIHLGFITNTAHLNRNVFSHTSGDWKSQIKVWVGLLLFGGLSSWLLVNCVPTWPSGGLFFAPTCPCVYVSSAYKGTSPNQVGATQKSSLECNRIFKDQIWSHSQVLGVRTSTSEFVGDTTVSLRASEGKEEEKLQEDVGQAFHLPLAPCSLFWWKNRPSPDRKFPELAFCHSFLRQFRLMSSLGAFQFPVLGGAVFLLFIFF